MRETSWLNAQ